MKKKFWMVAAALLALVVGGVALLSYAQENTAAPTAGWHGHKGHMGYFMRELNLTDAQKAQIKDILKANKQAGLPLMQQLAANKKAMLEATSNGNYDQAQIQALATQQGQLMSQLIVQKQAIQHQIYTQVLTPDQQTKTDQLRANAIARIDSRMQKLSQSGGTNPPQQ